MSVEERMRLVRALCRDARRLLMLLPEDVRERALAYREPLPESTQAALRRLRAEARAKPRTPTSP